MSLSLSETPNLLDSHDFQINHFKPYQYLRLMERSSVKVLQWPDTSPENLVSSVLGKIPLMSKKLPRSVCILSICSPIFVSRRISKETIEMGSSVRLSVRRCNEGYFVSATRPTV